MGHDFELGESYAKKLDSEDKLAEFRDYFYIPEGSIYFNGNSLGLLPKNAEKSFNRILSEWKTLAVKGWLEAEKPWFFFAERLGELSAPLVGADPTEVVATATTTVNIHSLISTFYKPEGNKTKILADELNFPTDIYALQSQIKLKGLEPDEHLILVKSDDGRFLAENKIVEFMGDDINLVFLPSVLFRSGQLLDIPFLTQEAHKRGITIGFDCSHSVGVVPHSFDEWDIDFAVWCSYKHLNSGPGSSAFLYINKRHFNLEPALTGWFGYVKSKQFDMNLDFEHAKTAGGWQISSPGILGSAPMEGALEVTLEAGIENIREKSLKMTSYLIYLVETLLADEPYNFTIGTPKEEHRRGGHVALEHSQAYTIHEELMKKSVVHDFRPPNVIRLTPTALYNSFLEIWEVISYLKEIMNEIRI